MPYDVPPAGFATHDGIDDAVHLHRIKGPITAYPPHTHTLPPKGSVDFSNNELRCARHDGGIKDIVLSADGATCYRQRHGKNNELFGVSMFMPTAAGQAAYVSAHQRIAPGVAPGTSCFVTTAGALRAQGLGVDCDRQIPTHGTTLCFHVCVSPAEGGAPIGDVDGVAKAVVPGFAVCNMHAAAEPIDLPDSKDVGGETAVLLLETVLLRKDLPLAVRFEAAVWQHVVVELTEPDLLTTIEGDEHLARILSLYDYGVEKRDVVTDDVIQNIDRVVRSTLLEAAGTASAEGTEEAEQRNDTLSALALYFCQMVLSLLLRVAGVVGGDAADVPSAPQLLSASHDIGNAAFASDCQSSIPLHHTDGGVFAVWGNGTRIFLHAFRRPVCHTKRVPSIRAIVYALPSLRLLFLDPSSGP